MIRAIGRRARRKFVEEGLRGNMFYSEGMTMMWGTWARSER
jgi:hypothetical protein